MRNLSAAEEPSSQNDLRDPELIVVPALRKAAELIDGANMANVCLGGGLGGTGAEG